MKLRKVVNGMKFSSEQQFECEICAEGKLAKTRSRVSDVRATKPLEFIHCDMAGPMSVPAKEGSKYAIVFVDDFSSAVFVYFIEFKSEAVNALERFLADSSPFGDVRKFRSDNALKFSSKDLKSVLIRNKIKQEFSVPHSPHQNGTAERMWRTLFEMARFMLLDAGLPKQLWNNALRTAAYVRNRSFCNRTQKTPFEALTGKVSDVGNMHRFGCQCYAYVEVKKKLDHRSEKEIFVGYDPLSPAYLIYFQNTEEIKRVRIVKFFENEQQVCNDFTLVNSRL